MAALALISEGSPETGDPRIIKYPEQPQANRPGKASGGALSEIFAKRSWRLGLLVQTSVVMLYSAA